MDHPDDSWQHKSRAHLWHLNYKKREAEIAQEEFKEWEGRRASAVPHSQGERAGGRRRYQREAGGLERRWVIEAKTGKTQRPKWWLVQLLQEAQRNYSEIKKVSKTTKFGIRRSLVISDESFSVEWQVQNPEGHKASLNHSKWTRHLLCVLGTGKCMLHSGSFRKRYLEGGRSRVK